MTTSGPSIHELTTRAANGEVAAWAELLRHHTPEMLAYIKHHLSDALCEQCEPADVLQDVYLAVISKAQHFDRPEPDAAIRWLLTLTRRRLIDLGRERSALKRGGKRSGQAFIESTHASVIAQLEDLAVYTRTPSQSAASRELRELVTCSIERLKPNHRRVLQLRYIEGVSVNVAAQKLRRTPQAIVCLCERALRALRVELSRAGTP